MFGQWKKFFKNRPLILPILNQIKFWKKANRKMGWEIRKDEFEQIEEPSVLSSDEKKQGFIGPVLCHGFGEDGSAHSDSVLSGKLAWEYAIQKWNVDVWQCKYIDFDKPEHIRLRPDAQKRPKGFYTVKFKPGDHKITQTSAQFRKALTRKTSKGKYLSGTTGCGPEGIQLLTITHPHLTTLMNERKLSFMTFADYDVAPHGFYDFYDAVQMFCSKDTLGLGIGNIDKNYPLFGMAEIRL